MLWISQILKMPEKTLVKILTSGFGSRLAKIIPFIGFSFIIIITFKANLMWDVCWVKLLRLTS